MTSPEEFRRYAEECLRWAREAQDDELRKQFLEMANAWTLAATQTDGSAHRAKRLDALMPITPLLRGEAFQPETVANMSAAFKRVCAMMGRVIDDSATRLVTATIIEMAQRGVRGDALRTMALQKFKCD